MDSKRYENQKKIALLNNYKGYAYLTLLMSGIGLLYSLLKEYNRSEQFIESYSLRNVFYLWSLITGGFTIILQVVLVITYIRSFGK
jgi:hypothetical protein